MGKDFGYVIVSKESAKKIKSKDFDRSKFPGLDFRVSRNNSKISGDYTVYSQEKLIGLITKLSQDLFALKDENLDDEYRRDKYEEFKDLAEAVAVYGLVLKELGINNNYRAVISYS